VIELLDNTVLSNFALVGSTHLIRLVLEDAAATTAEVQAEFERGVALERVPRIDWAWVPVLRMTDADRALYSDLTLRLSAGEASCLAMAVNHSGRVFTDDLVARRIASDLRVPVSGTLGLLAQSVAEGHVTPTQADDILRRMIRAGYRSPVTSLSDLP
jgi:predicted nucleic acid-binding protein